MGADFLVRSFYTKIIALPQRQGFKKSNIVPRFPPKLVVRPQTQKEAWAYLKYLLERRQFYKKQGYRVELPKHPTFSRAWKQRRLPWNQLQNIFSREYSESDFSAGLRAVRHDRAVILKALKRMSQWQKLWSFKIFRLYTVVLTLYGMGGSYESKSGSIIVKTTHEGKFVRRRPAEVIVHEIVHLGVEGLVRRYGFTHAEKEGLVDQLCRMGFGDLLKGYRISKKSDPKIRRYVRRAFLRDVPSAVSRYVKVCPRTR